MKEYLIVYQDLPFNQSLPQTMIVRSGDAGDAFILAANTLLRRGVLVGTGAYYIKDLNLTDAEAVKVVEALPSVDVYPAAMIRVVKTYGVQPVGSILEG